jgi:hypothetical protein
VFLKWFFKHIPAQAAAGMIRKSRIFFNAASVLVEAYLADIIK